jgi:hypothetical protein
MSNIETHCPTHKVFQLLLTPIKGSQLQICCLYLMTESLNNKTTKSPELTVIANDYFTRQNKRQSWK